MGRQQHRNVVRFAKGAHHLQSYGREFTLTVINNRTLGSVWFTCVQLSECVCMNVCLNGESSKEGEKNVVITQQAKQDDL